MASADRLRALIDLARTLSGSSDLEDTLRRLALHATSVTGSTACSVSLWDRERDVLVTLTGWYGQIVGEIDEADEEYPLADFPLSRWVIDHQQSRTVHTANPDDDPSERAILEEDGYASLLLLPLVSRGETVGLMEIVDAEHRTWDGEDMEFFRSLADIVGAAVQNAVLNDQSRAAEARYRTLVENLP